jgi:hypothetical protein
MYAFDPIAIAEQPLKPESKSVGGPVTVKRN